MRTEVTACYVIRGTDSTGGVWMTRELIWPSCDCPAHRRYVKLTAEKKAERMNKSGANVKVQFQELGSDGLWKDDIDTVS